MSVRCRVSVAGMFILVLAAGCAKQEAASTHSMLSGTLHYRLPVSLAPHASVQLQLTDVSASGAAPEIATATVNDVAALPYRYTLAYDPQRIDAAHRYTISARIYVNGQLQYATDMAIAVLTQGAGAQADIPLIAAGVNEQAAPVATTPQRAEGELFEGRLQSGSELTVYRAGFIDNRIAWLEESRGADQQQPMHARYDFKGALLLHYVDGAGFEFNCDENGRPLNATRNGRKLEVAQERAAINAARNRAALLRSHALSSRETQAHRIATRQDIS